MEKPNGQTKRDRFHLNKQIKQRAGGRVGQLKTRGNKSVHEGEQVSLKFPG